MIKEQSLVPGLLTTGIAPLAGDVAGTATPTFTLNAAGGTIRNIYYQVDAWHGTWLAAAPAGDSASGTTPPLSQGLHVLYAFAADSGMATSINTGQQGSPLIGPIAAYAFTVAVDSFTVDFAAGANGTLSGTSSQSVNYGKATTPVTALPDSGYTFVKWTGPGGFSSTDNPLTITNVTANRTATASFIMMGDVNKDSVVNVFDALQVLRYAVGLDHPVDDEGFRLVADVAPLEAGKPKGDNKVDVFDALAILRHAVGLDLW